MNAKAALIALIQITGIPLAAGIVVPGINVLHCGQYTNPHTGAAANIDCSAPAIINIEGNSNIIFTDQHNVDGTSKKYHFHNTEYRLVLTLPIVAKEKQLIFTETIEHGDSAAP
ncbi:hypothetical protein B0T16DRAFT_394396 [Cercophora newfieldiana]|uniref:Secreted protein n=1 Tax=Cercophora newfieldiana TaxID=92897 RepID=A0AA39XQQ9_9PEZI|nr:hypothetical protein B0T16DRAFT_394396 [Cercophora newfieldiana]